jgi:MmyB-like transcription regulator ligand binding domain
VDYYVRMERGDLTGVSASVLGALARALRLDDVEREYLNTLAKPSGTTGRIPPPTRRTTAGKVRPALAQVLEAVTGPLAYIRNGRHDMLAANRLARALFAPRLAGPRHPPNSARFVYLNPASRDFFADWDHAAADIAAILRSEAALSPHDTALAG